MTRPPISVAPITLAGTVVRLAPLTLDHLDALTEVCDAEVTRLLSTPFLRPGDARVFVEVALAAQRAGTALPFVTLDAASGAVIGTTRFGSVEPAHRRAEIGWTVLGRRWQRTGANTEAKLLMLRHAFEVWGLNRVEFKTDLLNERSQAAMARIGATREGVFRRHMVLPDGRSRDTVWFSIVAEEWPAVKARLEALARRGAQAAAPERDRETPR